MAAPVNDDNGASLARRHFLKSAALGGVAAVAAPVVGAQTEPASADGGSGEMPRLDASQPRSASPLAPSQETTPRDESLTYSSCGGDYMVDVLRSLSIEHFAATPGNTF